MELIQRVTKSCKFHISFSTTTYLKICEKNVFDDKDTYFTKIGLCIEIQRVYRDNDGLMRQMPLNFI